MLITHFYNSDFEKEDLLKAVKFFYNKLLGPRKKCFLRIVIHDNLKENEQCIAYTTPLTDIKSGYRIGLDSSLTLGRKIAALAHEMVHVWQYKTGKMRDYKNGGGAWKKQRYSKEHIDNEKDNYLSFPWECEAYRLEKTLRKQYNKFKRNNASKISK